MFIHKVNKLETKINIKIIVFDVRKGSFKTNWFIMEIKGPTSRGLMPQVFNYKNCENY